MFSYDVKFRHVGSGGGGAEHTHLLSKGVLPLERTPAALDLQHISSPWWRGHIPLVGFGYPSESETVPTPCSLW